MTYRYRHVELLRVVDGDTLKLEIDMGNRIKWNDNFRLAGIDTPELSTPEGVAVRSHVIALCAQGLTLVETYKRDKFGRWLADVYFKGDGGTEIHLNRLLLIEGYAVPYAGGAR